MKMKKLFVTLVSLGICSGSIAGLNGPTYHSRANCGNNESISWDALHSHIYCTLSDHYGAGGPFHELNTGWETTRRSAAVHWGEALPGSGWIVSGSHWEKIKGKDKNVENETVTDCSIYDGWWDTKFNNPSNEKFKTIPIDKEEENRLRSMPKGITIVPLKDRGLSEDIKKYIENKKSLTYKGYEESHNPYIKNLSEYNLLKESKTLDNNDPYDTHLKSNLSFIKLMFPFKGISFIEPKDIIGYAVMGGWNKEKDGWDGVSTFFNYKNVGICVYRKQNYVSFGGKAQLNKEDTTFDIGGYPTVTDVEGNLKDGFIYSLSWFDKEYFNDLDCYNKKFDRSLTKELINLGNRINRNK